MGFAQKQLKPTTIVLPSFDEGVVSPIDGKRYYVTIKTRLTAADGAHRNDIILKIKSQGIGMDNATTEMKVGWYNLATVTVAYISSNLDDDDNQPFEFERDPQTGGYTDEGLASILRVLGQLAEEDVAEILSHVEDITKKGAKKDEALADAKKNSEPTSQGTILQFVPPQNSL